MFFSIGPPLGGGHQPCPGTGVSPAPRWCQTVTSVLLLVARCRGGWLYTGAAGPKGSGGPSRRRGARPGRRGPRVGPPSQPPGKAGLAGTLAPLVLGQPSGRAGASEGRKGRVLVDGVSGPPNRL